MGQGRVVIPLYDFICSDGHGFERIVPLATFNQPQVCECGARAAKQVAAPRVISDCMDAKYGSDGKLHDSRASYYAAQRAAGHAEIGPKEELKAPVVDKKAEHLARRESIKEAIQDVKYGRVPPPPPPLPASLAGAYNG